MCTDVANRAETVLFDVSPEVLARGVRLVIFTVEGLHNRESDLGFEALKQASIEQVLRELAVTPVSADPVLQGFRDLHTAIGFSNRTYPPASESLVEYVRKHHDLPQINLLVDLYNLASVETRLSLGAHDLARVAGNVHLRLTDGSETFQPLGAPAPKPVRPGAYAYCDDDNEVICLLEVKQVEKTKATLETSDCLLIVQGNARTDQAFIDAAAQRLAQRIQQFCGGTVRYLYPPER